MRYIKSKQLSKKKYLITLEVTEQDLLNFEDLATTYEPFEEYHKIKDKGIKEIEKLPSDYFTEKYRKWTLKLFKVFCKLWKEYDK